MDSYRSVQAQLYGKKQKDMEMLYKIQGKISVMNKHCAREYATNKLKKYINNISVMSTS